MPKCNTNVLNNGSLNHFETGEMGGFWREKEKKPFSFHYNLDSIWKIIPDEQRDLTISAFVYLNGPFERIKTSCSHNCTTFFPLAELLLYHLIGGSLLVRMPSPRSFILLSFQQESFHQRSVLSSDETC